MEEQLFRTMLFDFYGDLLTGKQREYFRLHYDEDLSLSEIAEGEGISRQGVWDIIRRGEETLRNMEAKTGLVARYARQQSAAARLEKQMDELLPLTQGAARTLAEEIRQGIQELRHGI